MLVRVLKSLPTPTPSVADSGGSFPGSPSPSVPASNPATVAPHLTGSAEVWAMVLISVLAAASVALIFWYNFNIRNKTPVQPASGVTRQLLAMVLVSGILLLTVASMAAGDTDTTKVLTGAIVAAAGSAVAYYLASRNTDAAVTAAVAAAPEPTPDLRNMTLRQAQVVISGTSLRLTYPDVMLLDTLIHHQDVLAGTPLAKGATITVSPTPGPPQSP